MLDKKEIELEVGLSWDGEEKIENSAKIFLSASGDDLAVRLVAPYYGDLAPPGGQPGEPYSNLWDYEVVELFFLNDAEEYLELEFGPHAQHLVLLLKGTRNIVKQKLPLQYTAEIQGHVWTGSAIIPGSYFPPICTKINGYAIHGTGNNRKYEAVFEVAGPQPDFHRIHKFGAFNLADILVSNSRSDHSKIWEGVLSEDDK
ncbi:UPF0462 protein C4orf33 homolog isoform X2 [Eurytemora carolleeae]|uniref:UPF0462 protein C4orf33 homolog isoform X2 n=1 Tax=Eurytemora carolleeae TaxID=1294199 RepID=UPI000C779436|nr:UPF0462 protein C4orf33 homolog isoform X2 [Eurytemora carolleeae]|eukprot:XP_023341859.1 UPF0462 protein C4orf33 homolog isoform X2 [Eurytemora affinis]